MGNKEFINAYDLSLEEIEELSKGYTEYEIIRNPYSGQEILLDPLAVSIYDYLHGCEIASYWDGLNRARNWFMMYRIAAYYILID